MSLPEFLVNPNSDIYLSDNYLVLDFEGTNYDYGSALNPANRLLLAVWYTPEQGFVLERGSEYEYGRLLSEIEKRDFIVAHNAKFELQWLQRAGLDLSRVLVYDTMIGEFVLSGNRKRALDLNSVAQRYGYGTKDNFISSSIKSGICPSTLPSSMLAKYCEQDVRLTERVFRRQREELDSNNLLPTVYTRCIFTPVLADIERNGMHIDGSVVRKEYQETTDRVNELRQQLDEITGGINLNSGPQKAVFLYDTLRFSQLRDHRGEVKKTEGGSPLTDVETVCALKATTKKQKQFQELYKEWNFLKSALSKTLQFFLGVTEEIEDNVFYAQFNQTIAQTHRLTSSGKPIKFARYPKSKSVQFQNFPRKYKKLFNARINGWVMGERDAAQLEFRVAAYLGQDAVALADIRDKVDVHSVTAGIIFREEWESVNGDRYTDVGDRVRTESKAHTFKPLYGGKSGTDREREYYQFFAEKYYGIADTQQRWIDEVLRTKQLVTATGLIFYWPDTKMTRTGYVINSTNICNYPVQSLATADIIPIAVTYFWHYMKARKLRAMLVNTIHDSIITEEPPEETGVLNELAKQALEIDTIRYLKLIYNIDFNVPLEIESKTSTHWGK